MTCEFVGWAARVQKKAQPGLGAKEARVLTGETFANPSFLPNTIRSDSDGQLRILLRTNASCILI